MITPAAAALASCTEGSPKVDIIAHTVQAGRRRLVAQQLLDAVSLVLLFDASFLVVGYVLSLAQVYFLHLQLNILSRGSVILIGVALLVLIGFRFRRWPTILQTAMLLDQRAGTHNRFHTALVFSHNQNPVAFEQLALQECAKYAERFPVRDWTPLKFPRAARFLAAPLLLGALLFGLSVFFPPQPPKHTPLDELISGQADTLHKLADAIPPKITLSDLSDLKKFADEMKRGAERIRNQVGRSDTEKVEASLRELSSMENMLQAMKDAARDDRSTPEEMAALTAALAANETTMSAAVALKSGNPVEAGKLLEKMLQRLKRDSNEANVLQQLAQSMQEQAAKLSEPQKGDVARQMQQSAQASQSGQSALSEQSLQRLAALLQKMGGNRGNVSQPQSPQKASAEKNGSGSTMTQQQLDHLISQLENMKEAMQTDVAGQPPGPGDGQKSADGKSMAMGESFAKSSGSPGTNPSGHSGADPDEGHSDQVFDDKDAAAAPKAGAAKRLTGLPGDGESLQELVNTAGDASKAGRAYRQLYDAAAPAAQEAVEQENIPLGSQRFIRRYFENIRPKD